MLQPKNIDQIVGQVAKANLGANNVVRVFSEPTIDSQGDDALRVTIVIPPGAAERLDGDAVVDTLVQIQRRLREAGDERFPIVEYATEQELEDVGDPES